MPDNKEKLQEKYKQYRDEYKDDIKKDYKEDFDKAYKGKGEYFKMVEKIKEQIERVFID